MAKTDLVLCSVHLRVVKYATSINCYRDILPECIIKEEYFKRTCAEFLQTLSTLLLIISTDNIKNLVYEYQRRARYPMIYIRERDTGIHNATNKWLK